MGKLASRKFIYADNAATSPMSPKALTTMHDLLENNYGNASQTYKFGRQSKKLLEKAREIIASCINATPEEIFFTSGGTESDNWAIKNILFMQKKSLDILTTSFEHHAILNSCQAMKILDRNISFVDPNNQGHITVETLELALKQYKDVNLVSIMMANNELGTIQDIKNLCAVSHTHGAIFHTDAVQAVGHIPIDVKHLNIDLLSASGHKFNGPKGVGFLYVKQGTDIQPLLHGGSQELSKRASTENIPAIMAMAVALQENYQDLKYSMSKIKDMENQLLELLSSNNVKYLRNGSEPFVPGNMSLVFPDISGETLLHRLDLYGIAISTGSACDGHDTSISHVLKAIKLEPNLATNTVRISLSKYNSEDEIFQIANCIKRIITS